MATYRTRGDIRFDVPCVIQMGMIAAAQFTNDVAPDALLVFENGIWKYPRLDGTPGSRAGAIDIPNSTAARPQGPVRLAAWQGVFTSPTAWEMYVGGNPANTTNEPYPSGSAALYTEPNILVANASGAYTPNISYGLGGITASVILMPGQRFYLTTTGATNASVRLFFVPLSF